jgi:hypothetical protein
MKHLFFSSFISKHAMKRFLLFFITAFTCITSFSQGPNFSWVNPIISATLNVKHVVDDSGNIYTIGGYENTVDFNPGAGVYNLTSGGSEDIFISKTSPSGAFIWVKSIGASNYEQARSIALDPSGNILITGMFNGTLDFNPGAGTFNLSSPSATAYFALKLDNSGNFVWARSASGSQACGGMAITSDAFGYVYTTGFFTGTVDFDPGAGTYNLLAGGGNDAFVQKLDASGNLVWAKAFLSSSNFTPDGGHAISVDASGNVLTTGVFHETVDFDPGAGTFSMTSTDNGDVFISKLSSSGNFVWAKKIGGAGPSDDEGESIHHDASGNIYIAGHFSATADMDPGPGTMNFTASVGSNTFLSKLDASGNLVWAKQLETKNAFSSDLDANGDFYITGQFTGTADVDPGPGTVLLTAVASNDVYVCKINNSGDLVWARAVGSSESENGLSVAVDDAGGLSITGNFLGTLDFDPGAGVQNVTVPNQSLFILKLLPCQTSGIATITSCGPYTWINGVEYTSSNNTATHTFVGGSVNGCDSIVTLNLTIGDNQDPVPSLATLADVTGVCSVGSLTAPTATDNCSANVTATHNATLPITAFGTTVVTWTYNDGNGNTTTQTQNVIITDNTAPVPTVANLPDVNGVCSVGSLTAPTGTDNCGGTVTVTHNASLPITTIGTTVVTWTYDDGHGNTTTQTQNVVISNPVLGISIASNVGSSICAGSSVTFTATATDAGSSPSYQWKVNGSNVGTNSPIYNTTTLNNNDVVTCVVTSNLSCNTGTTATSNSIAMTVTPTIATAISIVSSTGTSICAGTSVTFTATPTNGGTPTYQWFVGSTPVGSNSATYTTTSLSNGQTVSCEMTSSLTCPLPAVATSNLITFTVNPTASPTISITSNPTAAAICSGINVTYTANITNGGSTPVYQWKLNGSNVGTNASTYSNNTLASSDAVTCELATNNTCAAAQTATSNSISKTINQSVTPTITITSNPAMPVCVHGEVTFTATITNGGTNPDYQWKKNNQNYGIGNSTYSTTLWSNGDEFKCVLTSNALCATPAVVTSNIIATNELNPDPEVTVSGNTITAEISGANYQWYDCATNAPIPNATQQSYTATQSGSYSVLISAGGCSEESDCQTINWSSLDEISANGIILYPNPAKDYFVLDLPENTIMDMTIYDVSGRKVLEGKLEGTHPQVDIHSLATGSYRLVLTDGDKQYVGKVIVNR